MRPLTVVVVVVVFRDLALVVFVIATVFKKNNYFYCLFVFHNCYRCCVAYCMSAPVLLASFVSFVVVVIVVCAFCLIVLVLTILWLL